MKKNLVPLTVALLALPLTFTLVSCGGAAAQTASSITGVTLNQSKMELAVGESKNLTAIVQPGNAADRTVNWSSSDSGVAKVANGLVTAVAKGTATIAATTVDGGKTDTCVVTVKAADASVTVPVTGVTVSPKTLDITAGQSHQLTATVQPDNATVKSVNWISDNTSVATVANGLVTAHAPGAAIITATTEDGGKTDTCVVTVKAIIVPVTGVAVSPKTLSLTAGQSHRITARVQPDMATVRTVNWDSSDSSVATVTNGLITAVAEGAATITATTTDGGKTDACAVTVRTTSNERRVYVAGCEKTTATLWADGVFQHITLGDASSVHSVFASGGNLYMAGYENNHAALWINGVPQDLRLNNVSIANSVFVSGGNVYVAGHEYLQSRCVATLWVNGVPQHLSDKEHDSIAHSVFVSGGNVYVAGHENDAATLWVNGVPQNLAPGNASNAKSVFVSGGNAYVAGYENNAATLWVNGVPQRLGNGENESRANAVFVSGNDVYVAGYEYTPEHGNHAMLWVNGVPRRLNEGATNAKALALFVSGNDVYVTGVECDAQKHNFATLWVNGVTQRLSPVSDACANSVFVDKGGV